jgi:hypothetical protein
LNLALYLFPVAKDVEDLAPADVDLILAQSARLVASLI